MDAAAVAMQRNADKIQRIKKKILIQNLNAVSQTLMLPEWRVVRLASNKWNRWPKQSSCEESKQQTDDLLCPVRYFSIMTGEKGG